MLAKHLIGLPGDHIEIQNGFVAINGKLLNGDQAGKMRLATPESVEVFYDERIGDTLVSIKDT